jgi:hypothetical protein
MHARGHRIGCACMTLAGLLGCGAAAAHEAGTTRVAVAFDEDRSYRIEIVTDASALAEKLEAAAGRQLPADATAALFERIMQSSDEVFRRRLRVQFDGSEARPDATYRIEPPADATSVAAATITLRGQIPKQAQRFTWSYGWTFTSYALTLRDRGSESPVDQMLEGDQASVAFTLKPPPTRMEHLRTTARAAARFAAAGWTAIVPNGIDHILFLLGLYFLSRNTKRAIRHFGVFAISSSIAIVASAFGLVILPPKILDPMIGLSLAYIAMENLVRADGDRRRIPLVFGCGLLHGAGCAAALEGASLPRVGMTVAVASFNLGIEAGQLATVAAAFLIVGWHCSGQQWYRNRVVLPGATLLACTAVYWTIARLPF